MVPSITPFKPVTPASPRVKGMRGLASLLVGAHQFLLHPLAVARAWRTLYGPVRDWHLVLAFFLHDLGYAFTPDLDGPQGERHVEFGARWMTLLCDPPASRSQLTTPWGELTLGPWGRFTLLHSRFYAAKLGLAPSQLCAADKLAIHFEPAYLLRVRLSGEVHEYMACARQGRYPGVSFHAGADRAAQQQWYALARGEMTTWAWRHAAQVSPPPAAGGGPP